MLVAPLQGFVGLRAVSKAVYVNRKGDHRAHQIGDHPEHCRITMDVIPIFPKVFFLITSFPSMALAVPKSMRLTFKYEDVGAMSKTVKQSGRQGGVLEHFLPA